MPLKEYLSTHYAKDKDPITHTRIGDKISKISGGKYNIINNNEFLESYYNHTFINDNKEYLTEKQLTGNSKRVVLDIDLRYSHDISQRQHTKEHIIDLIDAYLRQLSQLYDFDDGYDLDIYVMEKPNVNQLDTKTKDGIHLIFNICLNVKYQILIRKQLLPILKNLFDDLPLTNSIEDVIDEGIVKGSVNWQLYGSRKPNHQAYEITYIFNYKYDKNKQDWDFIPKDLNSLDMKKDIFKLSIRSTDIPILIIDKEIDEDTKEDATEDATEEDDDDDEEVIEPPITLSRETINKYIYGMRDDCWRCGEGNCAFKIYCALKKVGAKKCDIKTLMMKAGKEYDNDWFNQVWRQNTEKYSESLPFIKSKSSYREPVLPTGKCLINVDELEEPKKTNIHDVIWNCFIEWIKDNQLLRIKGTSLVCSKEKEYYAKVLYDTHEECLNGFINKYQSLFSGKGLQGKRTNIKVFLECNQPHNDFPFKELDWRYFGYKDGLFDLINNKFIREDFPEDVLCRKYFDEDFNPLTEIPREMKEIFNTQEFTPETIELNLALLGRTLYKINTLDNWGVILCNYGMSDTGKSTLTETITNSIEMNKVATIGLGEKSGNRFMLYKKDKLDLISITEAENIPKVWSSEIVKTISRGEIVEIEGKGQDAYQTKWETPIILASNGILKYNDKSNGINNRIAYFKYENTPKSKNKDLKLNLHKMIPRLIPFYVKKYFEIKDNEFELTEQMIDWRDDNELEENDFKNWLAMDNKDLYHQLVYEKGAETSATDIQDKFNNYLKFNRGIHSKHRITMGDIEELKTMKIERKQINICKFCKDPHKKGCCDDYTRTGRTKRTMYMNCRLINGGKNNGYDSD